MYLVGEVASSIDKLDARNRMWIVENENRILVKLWLGKCMHGRRDHMAGVTQTTSSHRAAASNPSKDSSPALQQPAYTFGYWLVT